MTRVQAVALKAVVIFLSNLTTDREAEYTWVLQTIFRAWPLKLQGSLDQHSCSSLVLLRSIASKRAIVLSDAGWVRDNKQANSAQGAEKSQRRTPAQKGGSISIQ